MSFATRKYARHHNGDKKKNVYRIMFGTSVKSYFLSASTARCRFLRMASANENRQTTDYFEMRMPRRRPHATPLPSPHTCLDPSRWARHISAAAVVLVVVVPFLAGVCLPRPVCGCRFWRLFAPSRSPFWIIRSFDP